VNLSNVRSISSTLFVGQLTQAGLNEIKTADVHHGEIIAVGDWYVYSTGPGLTAEDVVAAYEALPKPPECSNPFAFNKPAVCNDRINRATSDIEDEASCPVRISGNSPTIFIYGQVGQTFTLQPLSSITYAEPGLSSSKWNIKIQSGGTLQVNGSSNQYLYYEHTPVSFARPQKGWTTTKSNLDALVTALSKKFGLNSKEADRLLFELQFASSSVKSTELFVGIIPQKEVAANLPLRVSPSVSAQRLHFYVGKKEGSVVSPQVNPIQRTKSMILEIGAVGK